MFPVDPKDPTPIYAQLERAIGVAIASGRLEVGERLPTVRELAVEYKNEDMQMPPPKKKESRKLPDDQIQALKDWVKLGAPYGEKPVEAPPKAEK